MDTTTPTGVMAPRGGRKARNENIKDKFFSSFEFFVENFMWWCEFPGVKLTNWHRERIHEIEDHIVHNVPKVLYLWFRGGFKTTFISRYSNMWRYFRDPDLTILQRHGDASKAEGIVQGCKFHHLHNPRLRELFPEFCPVKNQKWGTVDEFTLPNTQNYSPEPTMRARGIEANLTGDHYRHVSDDDIENEVNINTPDTRLKLIRKWEDTQSILTKPPVYKGTHTMVGTTWHAAGLWLGHIIPKFGPTSEAPPHLKVVYKPHPACNEKLEPYAPEIFDEQGLKDLLYDQGPYKFSANYLLKPTDPDTAVFKEKWIQWHTYPKTHEHFDKWWLERCCVRRVLTIDLAESTARDSDMIGYLVVDIDDVGRWYIRECFEGRISVYTFIERVQKLHENWDFDVVYIDAIAAQNYFSKWLVKSNAEQNVSMPVVPVKKISGNAQSKGQRILACQPRWHRGDCYIVDAAPGAETLIHDMINYPAVGYDDLLDAMAQLEMMEGKGRARSSEEAPVGSLSYFQGLDKPKPTQGGGSWWRSGRTRNAIATVRKSYRSGRAG